MRLINALAFYSFLCSQILCSHYFIPSELHCPSFNVAKNAFYHCSHLNVFVLRLFKFLILESNV